MIPVSVVMPVYNPGRFYRVALESVAGQSVYPAELILVDDRSTDDSMAVAETFAKSAPFPVHIVRRASNSGSPVLPMNEGIERATSETIVLLDPDDAMTPERIALHRNVFQHADCALAFGVFGRIDDANVRDDRPLYYLPERFRALPGTTIGVDRWLDPAPFYENVLTIGAVLGASNLAFRKQTWHALGGFDLRHPYTWDLDFTLRATQIGKIGWHDAIVGYYRQHAGNRSTGLRCRREFFAHLCRHADAPLWPIDRARLRKAIADEALHLGYDEATTGESLRALRCYRQAARAGAGWGTSLARMAKIVPQRLRARFAR